MLKACQEGAGQRIADCLDLFFPFDCRLEASPLFFGVRQFAESVGNFDSCPEQLESFRHFRVCGFHSGKGGLASRVILKYAGDRETQVRLNFLHHVQVEAILVRVRAGVPSGKLSERLPDRAALPPALKIEAGAPEMKAGLRRNRPACESYQVLTVSLQVLVICA